MYGLFDVISETFHCFKPFCFTLFYDGGKRLQKTIKVTSLSSRGPWKKRPRLIGNGPPSAATPLHHRCAQWSPLVEGNWNNEEDDVLQCAGVLHLNMHTKVCKKNNLIDNEHATYQRSAPNWHHWQQTYDILHCQSVVKVCGMAMWQAGLCWPSPCLSCHLRRSQKTRESFQTSPATASQTQQLLSNQAFIFGLWARPTDYYVVTSQSQMQVSKWVKWKAGERRLHPMWNLTLEAKFSDAMKSDQKRHSPLPALHVSARKGWKHPTLKWTTQPITELWPCITNQAESVGKSNKK
jgi:hypothetical protein